jgi:hypothetical protein
MRSWIREEAAMAAITFNTALHAAARLQAALSATREKIDAFVSYQMRVATAEVERPDLLLCASTNPNATRDRNDDLARTRPGDEPADIATQFQPLDTGIVSDAIPAFFIGRNKDGFWVARDGKGRIGGLFLFESGALSFARRNSPPIGCATIYPSGEIELDLRNMGNPIVARLASLKRVAMRVLQRMA